MKVCMMRLVARKQVLATAASNIAVDNLVERLAAADPKLKLVRTGHAARLLPSVSTTRQPRECCGRMVVAEYRGI